MNTTRRQFIQAAGATGMAAAVSRPGLVRAEKSDHGNKNKKKKQALAIFGDAWHCVAPLQMTIGGALKARGYEQIAIMDYDVPFDDFDRYDLIVLSRYAFDDVTHYRKGAPRGAGLQRARWLTSEQEEKFEDYVHGGGRLFLHHDGIGFYPKDGAISRLAKAFFIKHPPIVSIEVKATGKMPELTEGVIPFTVVEEEFQVEMDETQTSVYLESHSPENGRAAQGWAHPYGEGKVAVLVPGHSRGVLEHPMVKRSVGNVIDWLGK